MKKEAVNFSKKYRRNVQKKMKRILKYTNRVRMHDTRE